MPILLVDDSAFARKRVRRLLERAGYDVVEAEDGATALRLLAEDIPDLIVMDLLMPEMDGMELLGRVRNSYPALPVLVHTADVQRTTSAAAIAAGATAVVPKTAPPDEIVATVRQLLASAAFHLSPAQQDAFMETMNIAMGQAADALASLLERHVTVRVPRVQMMEADGLCAFLAAETPQVGALIMQRFIGVLNGLAALILPHTHAALLVRLLIDVTRELEQLSSAERTVLTEVGNVILNAALARLGDQMESRLQVSLPSVALNQSAAATAELLFSTAIGARQAIVLLSHLTIGEAELVAYIVLLLSQADVQRLLTQLGVVEAP